MNIIISKKANIIIEQIIKKYTSKTKWCKESGIITHIDLIRYNAKDPKEIRSIICKSKFLLIMNVDLIIHK